MNSPILPDMPKEELWRIAFNLAVEVEQLQIENMDLREQLAQAQAMIRALQAQLALPKKTARNSSIPPASSQKARCEEGIRQPRA